jgi:NAD(P)-dependent dehydrogenase (short-subunit alcohol dehydrogenase family)
MEHAGSGVAAPLGIEPRVALVTGGTDGIGKAIAHVLAAQGFHVAIVGSNANKGAAAVRELRRASGHQQVEFLQADLSLMRNVDRLAAEVRERWSQLHYLVLCAGIMRGQQMLTAEAIETNFAVNYLGRFVLTQALLSRLAAGGLAGRAARILVISGAAPEGRIQYQDVNLTGRFGILRAVSQFCGANDLFALEQARRLCATALSPSVTITVLKVGAVRTNIRAQFPARMKLLVPLVIDPLLSQSCDEIAASARGLLTGPEFEGVSGRMFRHIRRFRALQPGPRTGDPEQGRRLWNLSELRMHKARAIGAPNAVKADSGE